MKFLTTGFIFFLSLQTGAAVTALSETIGRVGEEVLTSREAQLSGLIDRIVVGSKDLTPTRMNIQNPEAKKEITTLLLETALAKEATSFALVDLNLEEIESIYQKTIKALQAKSDWRKKDYTSQEVRQMVQQKLNAKALVKLKTESMRSTISDIEAKKYFEENPNKFGGTAYDQFQAQIKKVLEKDQLEERLKSWFEIIRRKYQVRESTLLLGVGFE